MPQPPTGPYEPQAEPGLSDAASRASTGDFVAPAETGPWSATAATPSGRGTTQRGRFTIERLHAQGGLGQVSLAHDGQLHRPVALKEIRPDRRDPDARRRFVNEAEITGLLEHPGVVPIYALEEDVGGEPYYVMRFVQGRNLGDAIQAHHREPTALAFRELLQRFVSVCQTMAYAHSRGVVHRDLKPANVMLGDYGETLVVDWGLAKKALSPERENPVQREAENSAPSNSQDAALSTQPGQPRGTPAYMAPEQARGEWDRVGTAADLFSLGAILYELLTSQRPYGGKNVSEVLDRAKAADFPPPRRRQAAIPRSLEAICLKAMAARPDDRYVTAQALADDVNRWLADEPVTAYREPWTARLRRWGRRHRALATGAAAAVIVLAASLGVGTVLLGRKNADLAKQLEQVTNVGDILGTIVQDLDPRAEEKGMPGLLAQLADRLEQVAGRLDAEAVGDPLVVARLQNRFGRTLTELGYPRRATDVLIKARSTLAAQPQPNIADVIDTQNNLGSAYYADGRSDQAIPLFQQTLEQANATLGPNHILTIVCLGSLAKAYQIVGRNDEALALFRETLAKHQATLGPDHLHTLISMNNLATAYESVGRLDQALPLFEQTLALQMRLLGPDHADTLTSMNNVGHAYLVVGRLDEAVPLLEQALTKTTAKLGPNHPTTLTTMSNLAKAYQAVGRLDKALPLLERTRTLRIERLGADNPDTLIAGNDLALGLQAAGRFDQALPQFEQLLPKFKERFGPDHGETLKVMNNLALTYQGLGRLDEALPLLEATLAKRRAQFPPDHPDLLTTMNNLAHLYQVTNRLDEALPLYEQVLARRRAVFGPGHPDTLTNMSNLATAYYVVGRIADAVPLLEESLERRRAKLGPDHPDTLTSMNNLARVYQGAGKLDRAVPLFEETLAKITGKLGPDHPNTLATMSNLAKAYLDAQQPEKALPLLRDFLAGQKRQFGGDDPRLAAAQANVASALLAARRPVEAEPILRECLVIREKTEPDAWTTFNTKSLLGEALLGQKKYAEAEPLLLAGYEGLKQREKTIPPQAENRLSEAVARLVQLYDAWNRPDEAAKWKKELEVPGRPKVPMFSM